MSFDTIILVLSILTTPGWIGVHQCEQGHRCVYYRGGSLLETFTEPGYHFKIPLITSHYPIQITWQTDKLRDVLCGSSRGGKAYLDIEVVNKLDYSNYCIKKVVGEHTVDYDKPLIFDYIPSEVAQFCKNYTLDDIVIREFDKLDEVLLEKLNHNIASYNLTNCLQIKKVRINRPKLDSEMQKKFESIENEQKEKELAIQQKETEKVRLEIQTQKEVMEKQRYQQTSRIEMEIQKERAESESEKQKVIDLKESESVKINADSEKYRLERIAEGNDRLFSNPNYIILEGYKSAHNNAKLIIGDVPQNAFLNMGGFTDYRDGYSYQKQFHNSTY